MSGKINNRTLLIVFIILVGLLAITQLTRVKNRNRSLKSSLAVIDTSEINRILLYPKAEEGAEVAFDRSAGNWTVSHEDISAPADEQAIGNLISELMNMETERLVARSADQWAEYHVNDSLATRVVVKEGRKTTTDLYIGRFDYQPPPGGFNQYSQNRGTGISFVRSAGEDEVYAVEGFLAFSMNQEFANWRNQTIFDFPSSQFSQIAFDYPADSGFIAQKAESGWMVSGMMADSASMADYLYDLTHSSHREFADDFTPGAAPDYQISIEGENLSPVLIRAYRLNDEELVLHSSMNPESWFRIREEDVFSDLFPGSERLLTPAPEEV